eukprot:5906814-Ditylum_brightwellii.AAC.1
MKPKPNSVKHARLNARGFKQVDGLHYDGQDLSAPVVNVITIRIVFVMISLAAWTAKLLDVKGAFLNGRFQNGKILYMHVSQGFKRFYPPDVLLLLLRTLYGLKQAAIQFWRELQKAFCFMVYKRNRADPCLMYKWVDGYLVVWMTW